MEGFPAHPVVARCVGADDDARPAQAAHAVNGHARALLARAVHDAEEGADHRLRGYPAVWEDAGFDAQAGLFENLDVVNLPWALEAVVQPGYDHDLLAQQVVHKILPSQPACLLRGRPSAAAAKGGPLGGPLGGQRRQGEVARDLALTAVVLAKEVAWPLLCARQGLRHRHRRQGRVMQAVGHRAPAAAAAAALRRARRREWHLLELQRWQRLRPRQPGD
mmetsp:Transcript_49610/g.130904  ORF Transcript_49610/g.130904 Transcript_49610/m.130904 type:complete len:220 (-) Transcript_49610:650-1309(-)